MASSSSVTLEVELTAAKDFVTLYIYVARRYDHLIYHLTAWDFFRHQFLQLTRNACHSMFRNLVGNNLLLGRILLIKITVDFLKRKYPVLYDDIENTLPAPGPGLETLSSVSIIWGDAESISEMKWLEIV